MILSPHQEWSCPNCSLREMLNQAVPNRFHPCAGLNGLMAPMVPAGMRVKVTANEREDYIGKEVVQLHQGRPVMSVVTERADGSNDVMVFAPSATGTGEST